MHADMGGYIRSVFFFILILLRSWQLYTEAAIWTLRTIQQQRYSAAVSASARHVFCPQFNKTANSGSKRDCLQLHLTAVREYCSNRPKSWELFQIASEAAKTCCNLNKLQQNFKVHEQNCLLRSIRRGNRKAEREGTINWLISSLWSFSLHLNALSLDF